MCVCSQLKQNFFIFFHLILSFGTWFLFRKTDASIHMYHYITLSILFHLIEMSYQMRRQRAGIAQSVQTLSYVLSSEGDRVKFLAAEKEFCLFCNIQLDSSAHTVSYIMSKGGSFPRGKAEGT
jgi:hypothetical protein